MEPLPFRRAIVVVPLVALAGCASIPINHDLAGVNALVDARSGGEHTWATDRETTEKTDAQIRTILSQPLTGVISVLMQFVAVR